MIAEMAAAGHPITMFSSYIPGVGERINYRWKLPVCADSGEPVYYTVIMRGVFYSIEGRWFDGHGQFVAIEARWRIAGYDTWEHGHPVTSLKLKILAVAVEMRAAEVIGQTRWLPQIAKLPASDRQAAVGELVAEGDDFIELKLARGDSGTGSINFYGLAGLGAYQFEWHRDRGAIVVDRVYRPAQSAKTLYGPHREIPAKRRRRLQARWTGDLVIMEMIDLAVARQRTMASV